MPSGDGVVAVLGTALLSSGTVNLDASRRWAAWFSTTARRAYALAPGSGGSLVFSINKPPHGEVTADGYYPLSVL